MRSGAREFGAGLLTGLIAVTCIVFAGPRRGPKRVTLRHPAQAAGANPPPAPTQPERASPVTALAHAQRLSVPSAMSRAARNEAISPPKRPDASLASRHTDARDSTSARRRATQSIRLPALLRSDTRLLPPPAHEGLEETASLPSARRRTELELPKELARNAPEEPVLRWLYAVLATRFELTSNQGRALTQALRSALTDLAHTDAMNRPDPSVAATAAPTAPPSPVTPQVEQKIRARIRSALGPRDAERLGFELEQWLIEGLETAARTRTLLPSAASTSSAAQPNR